MAVAGSREVEKTLEGFGRNVHRVGQCPRSSVDVTDSPIFALWPGGPQAFPEASGEDLRAGDSAVMHVMKPVDSGIGRR